MKALPVSAHVRQAGVELGKAARVEPFEQGHDGHVREGEHVAREMWPTVREQLVHVFKVAASVLALRGPCLVGDPLPHERVRFLTLAHLRMHSHFNC